MDLVVKTLKEARYPESRDRSILLDELGRGRVHSIAAIHAQSTLNVKGLSSVILGGVTHREPAHLG